MELIEMKGPDGTIVKATAERLRCLFVYWKGGTTNEDFYRDAAELLHHSFKKTQEEGAPPLATLPPTLLNIFHNTLGVERELLVTPLAATAGIFLHKLSPELLGSTPPTVHAKYLPHGAEHKWSFERDTADDSAWTTTPWTQGGIICARANTVQDLEQVRQILEKAQATAANTSGGKYRRVLVVVELPHRDKPADGSDTSSRISLSKALKEFEEAVSCTKILEVPPRGIPWATEEDWELDGDGILQSDPLDGTAEATTKGRSKARANARTLHAILYHNRDDFPPLDLSPRQTRELARTLAEIATNMPAKADAPQPRWFSRRNKETKLGLHNFQCLNDDPLDPRISLKAMVPEGEWQDDLDEPYTDGITPVSLVEHYQKKGATKSAAIAHAAHVTAGLAQDCNRIFETMLNTTATNLCRNAGVRIGTLCTPNDDTEVQGVCECCNRRSTSLWTVPAAHPDNAMKGAVKVMQEKRAENVCRREMALFPLSLTCAPTPRARAHEDDLQEKSTSALKRKITKHSIRLDATSRQDKAAMVKALSDKDKVDAGEATRGPTRVRDRIRELASLQPTQICMTCTITFHQAHASATPGSKLESIMWSEVCALAQRVDKPGLLKAVQPHARMPTTADIFGLGDLADKVGQDITWYEDGDEREGTVALIATDREGGDLKAYVVSNDNSTHLQTVEPWTELPIDVLQKASDTKKCHNERLYLRRREDGRSNLPKRRGNPERLPRNTEDEITAIKSKFAEADYVIEEPMNDPNALLYCLAVNTPNANATQLEARYQTMRVEILTYAQQHEDTYKRRVRIAAGAATEAMRNEAWQAWTQNITKTSHPLDELEADILGAMGHCPAIGMWNASQKKPMLVVYSRGGGEKLIYIDAIQKSDETEVHFTVRLGQNRYARATRQRTPVNTVPEAAPAPPTNEDSTVREDTTADTTRGKRLRGDERQSATSSSPNDSLGATQRAVEVGPEHPKENHTAPYAQLNLEDERQVAEAYKILQTFRLPTHDTTLNRCRHRGQQKQGLNDRQRKGMGGGGGENCGGSDSERDGSGGEKGWGRAERGDDDDDSSGGSGGSSGGGSGGGEDHEGGSGDGRGSEREGSSGGHSGCGDGDDRDWGSGGEPQSCHAARGDDDDDSSGGSGGSGGDSEDCGGSDSKRSGSGRRGGSPGSDPKRLTSEGEDASDGLVGSASEGENLDGEPQSCHAARGDTSDMTSEYPKSSCDAADTSRKRAPSSDEDRRAAKTRRQEVGRRTYGRSDSDGGDSGDVNAPISDDEGSSSTGTHGKAAGDGSNKHGDANAGSEARDDSSGCVGNGNGVGGVESSHRGSDSKGADARADHIARASEDKDHDMGATSRGSAPGTGTIGHSPEHSATRRDEAATAHAGLAVPGAGAEVTEEVASGGTAAAAATNGVSGTKRRARGKKRGGQQCRLSSDARKRYRKNLDKT
jgi:hypothetical protein